MSSLFKQVTFWVLVVLCCIGPSAIYSAAIYFGNELYFDPSAKGVRLFVTLFGPAAVIFQLGLAIVVLYTVGYRSSQTERQMELMIEQMNRTRRSDSVKQYLDHRKSFYELLGDIESKHLRFENKSTLYGIVFPSNSLQDFRPDPDCGGIAPNTVGSLAFEFQSIMILLEDLRSHGSNSGIENTKALARILSKLNTLLVKMGVSTQDFKNVKKDFHGHIGFFAKVPPNPDSTIYQLYQCLSKIIDFSFPPDQRRVYNLQPLVSGISESPMFSSLLENEAVYE